MTKQDLIDYCLTFPAVYEDYPFDGFDNHSDDVKWTVMRHGANKKNVRFHLQSQWKIVHQSQMRPTQSRFSAKHIH